ncbi:TPM domain-containing protein [Streptomyces polygonati]|uniref:TPM domain-containing protein n=1 Tax=Streptomyces polygonati TaxID=1617087 RepID=A0ABV8HKT8_9ACTN
MRKRRRAVPAFLAAVGAVAVWLSLPAGEARADDPARLARAGRITDTVDALGRRAPSVRAALRLLYDDRGIQLFVVYVGGFSGDSPQDWANATAVKNGLGRKDLLLAVATHDRQYAVSADQDSGLTQRQLNEVSDAAIEPALRSNDWAGAAIGAADGYEAVLAGRPVSAPAITPGSPDPGDPDTGDGAAELWIPAAALAVAAGVGLYAYRRRRGGTKPAVRPAPRAAVAWEGARPRPRRTTPITPLPELDEQARQLLVATDDAVRTSQEDVGFAAAQLGDDAARPFGEAVEYAQSELTAAFRLRQGLDDAFPADDETRRQILDEILSRCTQANRRLDAESEAFDRLRAMEENAPQILERAEAAATALPDRIAAAETALGPLARRYADSALEPVAGHPAEARDRLGFARTSLDQARAALGADHGRVAVFVRAAESALDQAATLADSVPRRERELAAADSGLRDALARTDAGLERTRGLLGGGTPGGRPGAGREDSVIAEAGPAAGPGTVPRTEPEAAARPPAGGGDFGPGVAEARLREGVARAAAVLADVRRELAAGRYDPIAALRRVEEAAAELDPLPAGAPERTDGGPEDGGPRGRVLLEQALLAARSEVAAARDVVTTHRGAIGSRARTRLTEAERRLRLAESAADPDVPDALEHARRADRLARDAQALARQDLTGYGEPGGPGGPGDAGESAEPGRPGTGRREGGGTDGTVGAVLGGILLSGDPGSRGDADRDSDNETDDGDSDSGRDQDGDGGPGPGSFGGGRTRGRMGGGGRF